MKILSNINIFNTCGMWECNLYTLVLFDFMYIFVCEVPLIQVLYLGNQVLVSVALPTGSKQQCLKICGPGRVVSVKVISHYQLKMYILDVLSNVLFTSMLICVFVATKPVVVRVSLRPGRRWSVELLGVSVALDWIRLQG